MPPGVEDDKTEDLQSSEQVTDVTEGSEDTAAQAVEKPETGAAASSPAPDEKPQDVLSVVRDVVSKSEEPASSAEKITAEEDGADTAADGEAKEPDDTDYSDVPFHKHPRFQKLLQQKREFETDAGRYRNIEGYLKQNQLSADEAADGLNIMALAKNDPKKALEQIKPFVQKLLIAAGEVLPDDLKSRVQSGDLPATAAMEISRARALAAQQQAAQEAADRRRQEEDTVRHRETLRGTANSWLQDRATRDPAFQSKEPLMRREVALLQREEGIPSTPEGVRDQLTRAYQSVNQQARVAPVQPAPVTKPALRPLTGGGAPGKPAPQPTSMLEAIRQARGA